MYSKARKPAATASHWINGSSRGPGSSPFSEVYTAVRARHLGLWRWRACWIRQRWYEVTDYIIGPLLSFPSTNHVINTEKWTSIPNDLQKIIVEEAAKSELEAMRLAAIQNEMGLVKNQDSGWSSCLSPQKFTNVA